MNKTKTILALKECRKGAIFVAKYYLWLIVLLFVIDILTKQLMQSILKTEYSSIVVIPHFFSFTLIYNLGAGWGILSGMSWLLISCSAICGTALVFILIYKMTKISRMLRISLSLMIPGAFGNLVDRAFYPKGVIDFMQFTFMDFPIFNLADSYLVIGVLLLIIWCIISEVNEAKKKKAVRINQTDEIDLSAAAQKMKKSADENKSSVNEDGQE